VVVLTPGAGDTIQTLKAGIMEIADVFAVNKCDLPGADRVAIEVNAMLDLNPNRTGWRPPVVPVSALTGDGVRELAEAVDAHRLYKTRAGLLESTRRDRLKSEVLDIVAHRWRVLLDEAASRPGPVSDLLERVASREVDPYTAAASVMAAVAEMAGKAK